MAKRGGHHERELNDWLDKHGYHHAHATREKTPHPYAVSSRMSHAARVIESPATGREIFAAKERDHHITTHGRQMLSAEQFALPPGPEEKRRGIKGRLPIDTIKRARSALARASMMHHQGHISGHALEEARRAVHRAWPEIEIEKTNRVSHARKIESPITGRELFATTERDHHITTAGRLILRADQFALPPGPEEKRRGIKGRLPIDTIKRARNALARAAQMKKRGHITAAQLASAKRKVHAAWPSIESEA